MAETDHRFHTQGIWRKVKVGAGNIVDKEGFEFLATPERISSSRHRRRIDLHTREKKESAAGRLHP
jgi:hypothetical protein